MIRHVRSLVVAVIVLVVVALTSCIAPANAPAPSEAEVAARSAAQDGFRRAVARTMVSNLYTDAQRQVVRDSIKAVKSEELGNGSITPTERNDGYTELWCFSFSFIAEARVGSFAFRQSGDYYALAFKRLNDWNGQISYPNEIAERCPPWHPPVPTIDMPDPKATVTSFIPTIVPISPTPLRQKYEHTLAAAELKARRMVAGS